MLTFNRAYWSNSLRAPKGLAERAGAVLLAIIAILPAVFYLGVKTISYAVQCIAETIDGRLAAFFIPGGSKAERADTERLVLDEVDALNADVSTGQIVQLTIDQNLEGDLQEYGRWIRCLIRSPWNLLCAFCCLIKAVWEKAAGTWSSIVEWKKAKADAKFADLEGVEEEDTPSIHESMSGNTVSPGFKIFLKIFGWVLVIGTIYGLSLIGWTDRSLLMVGASILFIRSEIRWEKMYKLILGLTENGLPVSVRHTYEGEMATIKAEGTLQDLANVVAQDEDRVVTTTDKPEVSTPEDSVQSDEAAPVAEDFELELCESTKEGLRMLEEEKAALQRRIAIESGSVELPTSTEEIASIVIENVEAAAEAAVEVIKPVIEQQEELTKEELLKLKVGELRELAQSLDIPVRKPSKKGKKGKLVGIKDLRAKCWKALSSQ